jgi:FkbM family methyltransferase
MTSLGGESPDHPLRLPLGLRLLQGFEFRRKLGLCERIFGSALSRKGVRWVRTAPGPVWKLDLAAPTHRWIAYGCYEGPSLWRWLRGRAEGIRTIVDSGANIGQTVLYLAAYLPRARIFAYEPGQSARRWLQEGIAANRFTGVFVEPTGLGGAAGKAFLEDLGGVENHGSWNQVHASQGTAIALASLDDEIERLGIDAVDLWKLDVEGYELEALRGAARGLAAGRIRAIYMELGNAQSESAAFLRERRYTAWDLRDSGRPRPLGETARWNNALFLAPGETP